MVTDRQVLLLRHKMKQGHTLSSAAAASDMSERTARSWQDGPLPSHTKTPRSWRTRQDPFDGIFDEHVVPLLQAEQGHLLRAPMLLMRLQSLFPDRFSSGQVRTLQRRIKAWRAVHDEHDKSVVFPQEHPPGQTASFDFTHADALGVTLDGHPFEHLLFTFKLAHSGWAWLSIAPSESFEALQASLQDAFWTLGGLPLRLRHDNLSAATHELRSSGGRALTERFAALMAYYGLESSRIRPGHPQENGVAERHNSLIKSLLAQALVLRGSKDFATRQDYVSWARETLELHHNASRQDALERERAHLQVLPAHRLPEYSEVECKVRRTSTVRVHRHSYSVPARLIGLKVQVRLFAERVEILHQAEVVCRGERLRGTQPRARIEYRHVIGSLLRKPGAFDQYCWREELFPSPVFRRAHDALRVAHPDRTGRLEYLRILQLAARTMESSVERALEHLLDHGCADFTSEDVRALAAPEEIVVPVLEIGEVDLKRYDALLQGGL